MRSVRCDVCGTKALMAASKCPKCSHPFAVRDGFGDLLPLAHCPSCDSDYPLSAGACKWCGTAPEKTPIGPYVWKGVGVAAFLSLAVGAFLIRDDQPPTKPALLLLAPDSAAVAAADSTNPPSTILQATPTDTGVVVSQIVSTGVVGTDTVTSALAATDTVTRSSTSGPDDPPTLAAGTASAGDSASAASDFAPVPVDSARAREPWLPPPSVIRRAQPPSDGVTESAPRPTSTGSSIPAANGAAPAPTLAESAAGSPPPRVAERDTRREAVPRTETPTRSSARRTVASAPPSTRPAPSRPIPATKANPTGKAASKPKAAGKTVAKSTPTRTPPRAGTAAGNTRTRTAAPGPRRPATVAKTPSTPRATARWVASVARQWAVVRADASGNGRIIGSVGPDTRVQLGEYRNGYRRIRAKGLAGWVHGRAVFATVPPRRSGRLATQ